MEDQEFSRQKSANAMINIDSILTEVELLNWLKIKPRTLTYLRLNRNLPCHNLDRDIRIYYMKDILNWQMSSKD